MSYYLMLCAGKNNNKDLFLIVHQEHVCFYEGEQASKK